MSLRYNLREVVLCAVLELTALMGAPVLPKSIHELMQAMHRTHLEESARDHSGDSS